MARQTFPDWADPAFRGALASIAVFLVSAVAAGLVWARSTYVTDLGVAPEEPVAFRHDHHVGEAGLDCRFCHASADRAATAGLPATKVCMTCHSQLFTDSPLLAPVRESFARDRPILWRRAHDLPDFVYFDHSVHVRAGVACASCHGRVDRMPRVTKARTLTMAFCLDCHRDPSARLVPLDRVYDLAVVDERPPPRREAPELVGHRLERLTDCVVCHR